VQFTPWSRRYTLEQFHFHRPSEHLINGKKFEMEAHFVHRNATGAFAVIGVLMATGNANPVFNKVVSTMPAEEGPAVKADAAIDPNGLLPAPSASGVCCSRGKISSPRPASRDCTAGSASASTAAALILPMMSLGVPLGAKSPNQLLLESAGKPISPKVGMSDAVVQARLTCHSIGFYAPGSHQRQVSQWAE
jgi:hypothetical protein